MNRKIALALASLCITAGPALADDITIDPQPFTSTLSRAQVMEELAQFRRSGVNPWAQNYDQLAQLRSTNTRADVRSSYLAERDTVAAFGGEDSGSAYMGRMAAGKAHPASTSIAKGE